MITEEFAVAERLSALPPYLFVEIDRMKAEAACPVPSPTVWPGLT